MNGHQRPLLMLGICLVLILLSVWGLASDFVTRLLHNVDGLLLLAVCLLMLVIFGAMIYVLAVDQGWVGKHNHGDGASAGAGK